jgi:thiamine-phosphate pyrophosphorylase
MKIIVVSSSAPTEAEAELVKEMFELGLERFHFRKPDLSTREMVVFLKKIPDYFHERIMIHSHHRLAGKFKLGGIHLTKSHLKKPLRLWFNRQFLNIKNPGYLTSVSFRKLSSLYSDKNQYSYVMLSPVFDSLTGNFHSGFNEFSLRAALGKTRHKVIARGGTKAENLLIARDLGFDGVAFGSCIWKSASPIKELERILNVLQKEGIKQEVVRT